MKSTPFTEKIKNFSAAGANAVLFYKKKYFSGGHIAKQKHHLKCYFSPEKWQNFSVAGSLPPPPLFFLSIIPPLRCLVRTW